MRITYKTKARENIVSYLMDHSEKRFTAREIYDYLLSGNSSLNRTTVYRNLDRMCESGELMRFKEPNQDAWYYQYSTGHGQCNMHLHAQCSNCGRIFHLENTFVDEFSDKLSEVYSLNINCAKSIIIGTCSACSKRQDS